MTTDTAPKPGPWARFGWIMPLMWLVFLAYPIAVLVSSPAAPPLIVLGWLALVVFAVAYAIGSTSATRDEEWGPPTRLRWMMAAVMVAATAASVPAMGAEAMTYFPFLMAYASWSLRAHWHWVGGGLCLGILVLVTAVQDRWEQTQGLLAVCVVILLVNTLVTLLVRASIDSEKRQLRIALADQRVELGRDVHDLLGHSLTVIRLKAQVAHKLIDRDPDRARAELEAIIALSGEAIQGVRSTVSELKVHGLDEQVQASRAALESGGIAMRVTGDPDALSPAQQVPASWVLREATTNIIRHAGAHSVEVRFAPGTLCITDDGVGVTDAAGNGIDGMTERVHASGGHVRVGPGPSGGTEVVVTW